MAFDGSGNFVRLHNWTSDAANNIDINAGEMDGEDNGFAAGLTLCVTRDGQGKMAADFTPSASGVYNLGTAALSWLNVAGKSITIGPPSSGPAATFTGIGTGGNKALQLNAGGSQVVAAFDNTNATGALTQFTNSSIVAGFFGTGSATITGAALADFCLGSNTGWLRLGYNNGAGTALGIDPSGNVNLPNGVGTNISPAYAGIPQNSQSGAYQLVLADANKHIYKPTGTATITIPANASVAFPVGTAITIVNDGSGPCNIAITTDALIFSPSGSAGTRTLAEFGVATILKVVSNRWYITGTGLS